MKGKQKYDVCLVSMPYAGVMRPSLALGIIKQILVDAGLSVKVVCADLLFAEKIGLPMYTVCSHQFQVNMMVGEWTFSKSAFPDIERDDESYLDVVTSGHKRILGYRKPENKEVLRKDLLQLREDASEFIEELAVEINEIGAKIVGCTSTFEQNVASLALLRKLKEHNPEVKTIMGGANCEGDMGAALHRNYPWLDYVVSGEADGIVASLFKNILETEDIPATDLPKGVRGPAHRGDLMTSFQSLPRITYNELNELPIPDFRDYFNTLRNLQISKYIKPGIPLETSRGCWWGAIHHCTFCGLNGTSMSFRSKSPERVIHEIETLEATYNNSKFEVVDNIIDMKYLKTVMPVLAESKKKRQFFYEVKSNLTRKQVSQMKEAGIGWVQPGIESLHSEVLRVIDKGTKGWQNIQLLKWAREFGVRLSWSILWDFPDEKDEWYFEMLEWMPLLEHLQAPGGLIPLRYDRYSVYHSKPEKWNLKLRPMSAMHYVYGLPESELNDLAYFFINEGKHDHFGLVGDKNKGAVNRPGLKKYLAMVDRWTKRFWSERKPILSLKEVGESLVIIDTRSIAKEFNIKLEGLDRKVMIICDDAPRADQVSRLLKDKFDESVEEEKVKTAIDRLKDLRLVLEVDNRLIALPVRGNLPALPKRHDFPGGALDYGSDFKSEIGKLNKTEPVKEKPDKLIAKKQVAQFTTPLLLDSGKELSTYQISYQTYGTLSPEKDNAILVFHSFTKDDHLAGKYNEEDKKTGWWDKMVGPGKTLDTNKYFVICTNVLGGCGGSTGPSSIDPATGQAYGMNFPMITVRDMVRAQKNLIDELGINRLDSIIGGCFGGAQALEWLIQYPKSTRKAVLVAVTPATSAHTIAISKVMRDMICGDPNWNEGNYYGKTFPEQGLVNGILVAVPIWMSRAAMENRFGRKMLDGKKEMGFDTQFVVEKFMEDMGAQARHDLDPNSLLYMSRAVEYFDLAHSYGSLVRALQNIEADCLFVSYSSDWRYPSEEMEQMNSLLKQMGRNSKHIQLKNGMGHGAFLYDTADLAPILGAFVNAREEAVTV